MTIPHLELLSLQGQQLHLFGITVILGYWQAEAYVTCEPYPEGTVFKSRGPQGQELECRTEQALQDGFFAFPGDKNAFGQLQEAPLFRDLGSD